VSFNGGKDATIVLYLTYFALQRTHSKSHIECIYFEEKDPFPEVDAFMSQQIE
jgi:3'-phosphoadenosine 5'-phosphosulfate sulfotransferase (PAPS reductase)/FAD synthetase